MPFLCNRNLTPLQRGSLRQMGAAIGLTAITNFPAPRLLNLVRNLFPSALQSTVPNAHPSTLLVAIMSALSVLPVLFAVWVIYRYLKAEPDEFIRAIVVRALLLGFAATMVGIAIADVYINLYSMPFPLAILNADIFFISTGLSLRLLLRSYR